MVPPNFLYPSAPCPYAAAAGGGPQVGVPLSSEPKRTLKPVRANLSALERWWFNARSMHSAFHKANAFNMLCEIKVWSQSLACRTETRTNDIQSEQLPVLVRLRDGSEIFREVSRTEGESWPIPCKNVLSVRPPDPLELG
jgi:hypothetical protein